MTLVLNLEGMKKYAYIEVHSPIVTEGALGYSAMMDNTGGLFQRACTYHNMLI